MSFNLSATLTFHTGNTKQQIKSLGATFANFKKGISQVGRGLSEFSAGARSAALAAAPLSLFTAAAINEAGKFEKSLDAVQSILRVNDDEMKKLSITTKFLGATTKFTATEANRGAQLFAQAGFSITETMAGLPAVLDAAAAGEISVAEATNLVASNVRAFGLEAKEATKVSDILAETAALTNTTMLELGEGLKLSAAKLKGFGFSLSEGAAAIGVLANVGVKGTLAGTAVRNALQKLAKPTKETIKLFGGKDGLASTVTDANGAMLSLPEIMLNIAQVMGKGKNKLDDMRKAAEIFGIRGEVAFGAFREQASQTFKITKDNLPRLVAGLRNSNTQLKEQDLTIGGTIPKLVAMQFLIEASTGAANKMSEIRMGNFLGQLTLLSSAFNNLQIEIGSLFLDDLTSFFKDVTKGVQILTLAFQSLNLDPDQIDTMTIALTNQKNQFVKFLKPAQEFAKGFVEGFNEVRDVVISVFNVVKDKVSDFFGSTGLPVKDIGKLVAKFLLFGAIAAPILAGVAAALFVIGPIFTALQGGVTVMLGLFGILKGVFFTLWVAAKFVFLKIATVILGMTAPALLLAAAIISIIAIVFTFRDKFIAAGKEIFGFFEPALIKIKNAFIEAFGGGLDTGNIFTDITNMAKNAWDTILTGIGFLVDGVLAVFVGIASIFAVQFEFIIDLAIAAWKVIATTGKAIFAELSVAFSEIFDSIKIIFTSLADIFGISFDKSEEATTTFIEDITGFFKGFASVLKFIFELIKPFIVTFFKFLGIGFVTIVKVISGAVRLTLAIIEGIVTGIKGFFNIIEDLFSNFGTNFDDFISFFKEIGNVFEAGKKDGGVFGGLLASFLFVKDSIVEGFKGLGTKLVNLFVDIVLKIGKTARKIGTSFVSGISGIFDSFFGDDKKVNVTANDTKPKFTKPNSEINNAVQSASSASKAATDANKSATKAKSVDTSTSIIERITNVFNNKEDKPVIVKSTLECDGQVLARAVGKANNENSERQGQDNPCGFKRGLVNRAPTGTGG